MVCEARALRAEPTGWPRGRRRLHACRARSRS